MSLSHVSFRSSCDGDCDGALLKTGHRAATAILTCQVLLTELLLTIKFPFLKVPDESGGGGLTVFPKADVTVRLSPRSALMVSYVGSDGRSDEGHSARSECPVKMGSGEKLQAVLHLRRGVSEKTTWKQVIASDDEAEEVSLQLKLQQQLLQKKEQEAEEEEVEEDEEYERYDNDEL